MNHRLGAAIAALALISIPAIATANAPSWGVVTGWDNGDRVANVLDHLWSAIRLKHTATTAHAAIDWTGVPPGPCRQIAKQWDVLVAVEQFEQAGHHHHHDGQDGPLLTAGFEFELNKMANHQCKITFVGGSVNPDGSTNLNTVAPSP